MEKSLVVCAICVLHSRLEAGVRVMSASQAVEEVKQIQSSGNVAP